MVDKSTVKVISRLYKFTELMELGIDCIESLELDRQRYEDKQAIYYISPTQSSVASLIKDFNKKKTTYDAANLFFSREVSPQVMLQMATCPELLARIEVCQ